MLANAVRELAAIRRTAEEGAWRILTSAEGLLSTDDNGASAKAEDAALSIITACGFDDLVGQRTTKIAEDSDSRIAARLKRVDGARQEADAGRQRRKAERMRKRPDLPAPSAEQASIDALFAKI